MNMHQVKIGDMEARIQTIKNAAEELNGMADSFPAIARNTVRILASIKMLELNVTDLNDI